MATKKLLDENNQENTIVHIIFRGKFNEDYECAGVLMKDRKDMIRVAFGAKNDKVVDYLDIKRADIVSIEILGASKIDSL